MTDNDLFAKLAEKFDSGQIVGAPMAPSLLKILMLLFTPEEAEIALKLPFQNTPLEEAMSIYPEHGDGIETILDNMATICNCCGCCCTFLRLINENWGLDNILSYSNYVANVDADTCVACGVCEDRCPVGAIKVAGELAGVDPSKCLGCGACTSTCDSAAVRLVVRETVYPPPQVMEILEARMK